MCARPGSGPEHRVRPFGSACQQSAPGRGVPHLHRARAAHQPAAIRTEMNIVADVGQRGQDAYNVACRRVPEAERVIRADGSDLLAVRAKGDRKYRALVPAEHGASTVELTVEMMPLPVAIRGGSILQRTPRRQDVMELERVGGGSNVRYIALPALRLGSLLRRSACLLFFLPQRLAGRRRALLRWPSPQSTLR